MREPRPASSSSSPIGGGRSASLRSICAMIPPDAGDAPTCGSGSLLAAADVLSNPVSSDGKPLACLMGAQLSAATGRSSDSSAACASAKKSRARKAGSAARGRGPRSPGITQQRFGDRHASFASSARVWAKSRNKRHVAETTTFVTQQSGHRLRQPRGAFPVDESPCPCRPSVRRTQGQKTHDCPPAISPV